jgi:hypothetical protein
MDYAFLNPILAAYMGGGVKVYTPLDPIDPDTVGRANSRRMEAWAIAARLTIFATLFSVIAIGAHWMDNIDDVTPVYIDPRYLAHMQELTRIGLVADQAAMGTRGFKMTWIRFWNRYFAVEKTAETSRSIVNGRRLSERCPSPPNVNLLTQPEVIQLLRERLGGSKKLYFIELDLRHWFHQIAVCEALQRFFGLMMRVGPQVVWFAWKCLPMGWSWSPAIAQAAGWMCLLFVPEEQKPIFDMSLMREDSSSLPRWLTSTSKKSFALVYYDNILVVSTDLNECDTIEARLRLNVSAEQLNVEIKGELHRSVDNVKYLGMEIVICRDAGKPHMLITPAKVDKWATSELKSQDTCRNYASFVGRVLFVASLRDPNLRRTPLGKIGIELARVVGRTAHARGWNTVIPRPKGLKEAWTQVLSTKTNPIRVEQQTRFRTGRVVLLATDASSKGWGYALYTCGSTNPEEEMGGIWSELKTHPILESPPNEHIFYKELRAALYGLSKIPEGTIATLVVDNAAVAWVLRNGFCRTQAGNDLLQQYEHLLQRIHDVVLVVSNDNPADDPSRGLPVTAERTERMLTAIELHQKGIRWASERQPNALWAGYRHVEPPEADDLGPDDEQDEEAL